MENFILCALYFLCFNGWSYNNTGTMDFERNLLVSETAVDNSVSSLLIYKIEFANAYSDGTIETDYGNEIFSENTMYLKPRIKYVGKKVGRVKLQIKVYKPDGTLSTGSNSPYGYSYEQEIDVNESNSSCILSGWGREEKGNWASGDYRWEIWCNGELLESKTMTVNSSKFSINKIELANVYSGGTIETDFGNEILSENTMYLQPKIYFSSRKTENVKLQIKLYKPDGTLSTGSDSPDGFTYEQEIAVNESNGSCILSGWGTEEKGRWPVGDYRWEIWCNGELLNSKIMTINSNKPLSIYKIEFANAYSDGTIETDFGNEIYSENTMYLKPKISYTSRKTGKVELQIKVYKPDGTLSKGSSSPYGCSYEQEIDLNGSGSYTLMGWGSNEKGNWASGNYGWEIWCDDCMLAKEYMTVHYSSSSVAEADDSEDDDQSTLDALQRINSILQMISSDSNGGNSSGSSTYTPQKRMCQYCKGTGECPFCNRAGQSLACVSNPYGTHCSDPYCIARNHRCSECGGTHICPNCKGSGYK